MRQKNWARVLVAKPVFDFARYAPGEIDETG
jgi:hypothetical protein